MKKTILLLILSISSLFAFSQVTVQLDGSGSSDPDGTISSYTWRFISGPVSVNVPSVVKPSINLSVAGVYKFGLRVTDNAGAVSAEDTMQVTIMAANVKPKANAGPDQTITLPTVAMIETIELKSLPKVEYSWVELKNNIQWPYVRLR